MSRVCIEKAEDRRGWYESFMATANLTSYDQQIMNKVVHQSPFLWRGSVDGDLACIWGLIPPTLLSNRAYLWLYTTKKADEHQFLLVRYSQRMIEEMLKEFDALVGHCVIGNDRAIRWVRWLGGEFGEVTGNLIHFRIEKKNG